MYYTCLTGVGVGAALVTFTHSLSLAAAGLIARPIPHQAGATVTAPINVITIGTNIITVGTAGALQTCDLEVQQVHSIIS